MVDAAGGTECTRDGGASIHMGISSLAATDCCSLRASGTRAAETMLPTGGDRPLGGPGRSDNNMATFGIRDAPGSTSAHGSLVGALHQTPVVSPPVLALDTAVPSLIDGCHANPSARAPLSLEPSDAYSVHPLLRSGDAGSRNAGAATSLATTCGVSGSGGRVSPRRIPAHFPRTPHIARSDANWSFRSPDVSRGEPLRARNWIAYSRNLVIFRLLSRLRPDVQNFLSAQQFDSIVNELAPTPAGT